MIRQHKKRVDFLKKIGQICYDLIHKIGIKISKEDKSNKFF